MLSSWFVLKPALAHQALESWKHTQIHAQLLIFGQHMRNHGSIPRSTETCRFMLSSWYWLTHDDTNQHMQVHAKLSIHAHKHTNRHTHKHRLTLGILYMLDEETIILTRGHLLCKKISRSNLSQMLHARQAVIRQSIPRARAVKGDLLKEEQKKRQEWKEHSCSKFSWTHSQCKKSYDYTFSFPFLPAVFLSDSSSMSAFSLGSSSHSIQLPGFFCLQKRTLQACCRWCTAPAVQFLFQLLFLPCSGFLLAPSFGQKFSHNFSAWFKLSNVEELCVEIRSWPSAAAGTGSIANWQVVKVETGTSFLIKILWSKVD